MTVTQPKSYTLILWGLSFQALWFLTVELASRQHSELAAIVNAAWVLALVSSRPQTQRHHLMKWGVSGLIIGGIGDGLIIGSGLYIPHQTELGLPTPLWLLAMWLTFSVFVPLSMGPLLRRPLLALTFGVFGAPLSYLAGVRWGAMAFGDSALVALSATGVFWGLAMYFASLAWKRGDMQVTSS